uniref:Uncharacterized protein n=1 Tax=Lotharella globosa TaxID=91324 RepID=A0A6V3MR24_9EUKA
MTVPKKIITVSVGDSPWADYRKLPTQCRTEACKAEFVLLKCGWLVSPSRGLFYGFSVSFSVIYKNKKDRFKVRALLVHTVSIFGGWLMRSYWRQTLDLVAKAPRDFDIWYNGLQKLLRITKQRGVKHLEDLRKLDIMLKDCTKPEEEEKAERDSFKVKGGYIDVNQ